MHASEGQEEVGFSLSKDSLNLNDIAIGNL